jgi:hypothetical protein
MKDGSEGNEKKGDDLDHRDHRQSGIEGDWDWRLKLFSLLTEGKSPYVNFNHLAKK